MTRRQKVDRLLEELSKVLPAPEWENDYDLACIIQQVRTASHHAHCLAIGLGLPSNSGAASEV